MQCLQEKDLPEKAFAWRRSLSKTKLKRQGDCCPRQTCFGLLEWLLPQFGPEYRNRIVTARKIFGEVKARQQGAARQPDFCLSGFYDRLRSLSLTPAMQPR